MGISRDSRHKRRLTGGAMPVHQKKRQYEGARPNANTKIGEKRIRLIRTRGGNRKFRALRLDHGNFTWQSEGVTRKCAIQNVLYNATNNELVRTKTLVKNSVILIDATPFANYINTRYYGVKGDKLKETKLQLDWEANKTTKGVTDKYLKRRLRTTISDKLASQFKKGHLYACISSRPGQSGRCDGYILEGKELEFYTKKMLKKK